MVKVMKVDYNTKHYVFSIDTVGDIDILPKYGIAGKENMTTISSVNPGSTARRTNGDLYILNGDRNEWVKVSNGGSGGNTGGDTGSTLPDDWEIATKPDIDALF